MKRQDWRSRLSAYIEIARHEPFSWTHNNCLQFIAGAVGAMSGIEYWLPERRRLSGCHRRSEVVRFMREYGGDLEGAADAMLAKAGAARVWRPPSYGDVVMHAGHSDGLGVSLGRLSAFVGTDGLIFIDPLPLQAVWCIGNG